MRWLVGAAVWLLLGLSLFGQEPETQPNRYEQLSQELGINREGWQPNPEAVNQVSRAIPFRIYAQVEQLAEDSDTRTILLYRYLMEAKEVDRLQTRDQGRTGSCVGYGTACAIDMLSGFQIAFLGRPELFAPVNADAIYALGRQAAGQLGNSDGSTGAWSVKGISELGTLHQFAYPGMDLTEEHDYAAKALARDGIPSALLEFAARHPVKAFVLVRDWKHARGLIQSGYPLIVCSGVGFENGSRSMTERDSLGFATARGRWMHCMAVVAYRGPDTGREGFLIQNSWNPRYIDGPVWPDDQPEGSFWVDTPTFDKMIGMRDTWGLSDYAGFRQRQLPLVEVFSRAGGTRKQPKQEPDLNLAP